MIKLILLRHLQSEWNKANKFTGWTDVSLSEEGRASATGIAEKLKEGLSAEAGKIDAVFTSPLSRNQETTKLILQNLSQSDLSVSIDKALDERNYGEWQGMNKDEVKAKFGEEEYVARRRGWDMSPPQGESLEDVYNRVVPYYHNFIEPELKASKNVLVVASHNSLRALAKFIEDIPDDKIADYEILSGGIIVYTFDDDLKLQTKKIL